MKVGELFETQIDEAFEPVVKVGETADASKVASEIGRYVVTPLIERYLDEFLQHFAGSLGSETSDIAVWIAGHFGSGKSHLAKVLALLAENRELDGVAVRDRFAARLAPRARRRAAILRSLERLAACRTEALALNLSALSDRGSRPLGELVLSAYYVRRGYCSNLLYARVVEAELDRQGKLEALHRAVEARSGRSWAAIQDNPSYFRQALCQAASEVAPAVFDEPASVERALDEAGRGELYNARFVVRTVLDELGRREQAAARAQRFLLVVDEAGSWIGEDDERLAQLQALVEEAARQGRGRLWVVTTSHGEMASVCRRGTPVVADVKKIQDRFRFHFTLTTENISLVVEERLLRKARAGSRKLRQVYRPRSGAIRGLGEPARAGQPLPSCDRDGFVKYYPFFPYQVHLVPGIVRTLRRARGHAEPLGGSTRTLLGVVQDVLCRGRRRYLELPVGAMVSFDEIYANLAAEGEIEPAVRGELERLAEQLPGASDWTVRVAEVLFLVGLAPFVPRTTDNLARLLVTHVDDDPVQLGERVAEELDALVAARLAVRIGQEYEFVFGERRSFEREVAAAAAELELPQLHRGLHEHYAFAAGRPRHARWLGSASVSYAGVQFPLSLTVDGMPVGGRRGAVSLEVRAALAPAGELEGQAASIDELEQQSLRPDRHNALLFVCGEVPGFDADLARFLATRQVIDRCKGDPDRSERERALAREREAVDLPKLERRVVEGLEQGVATGSLIFRGSSRALVVSDGQRPADALHTAMAACWPAIFPKFDRVPVRLRNVDQAIQDVLAARCEPSADVQALRLYDSANRVDRNCPLLDAIRVVVATEQRAGRRPRGRELCRVLSAPPYGWDPAAVRVGVAALCRAGSLRVWLGAGHEATAPEQLIDVLRTRAAFDRAELEFEDRELEPEVLTGARSLLVDLTGRRNVDETPAAIAEAAGALAHGLLARAQTVTDWSDGSGMPLGAPFAAALEAWRAIAEASDAVWITRELFTNRSPLRAAEQAIENLAMFRRDHGTEFSALAERVLQLRAVQHRLDPEGEATKLLAQFDEARAGASFVDDEVWARLQQLAASAQRELEGDEHSGPSPIDVAGHARSDRTVRVHLRQLAATTTVRSIEQWTELRERLDRRVRQLLQDGWDVDIS